MNTLERVATVLIEIERKHHPINFIGNKQQEAQAAIDEHLDCLIEKTKLPDGEYVLPKAISVNEIQYWAGVWLKAQKG